MGSESKARHQRHHSAPTCGYGQVLPDFIVRLSVSRDGLLVAETSDLERTAVADELHRLRLLFPADDGYDLTAHVKERTA